LDRDRNLTLLQNYRRLGLTSRLGAATGGTEETVSHTDLGISNPENGVRREEIDALAIPSSEKPTKLMPTEARVERDPETGRILRVIRPEGESENGDVRRKRRRLDDPLDSESDSGEEDTISADPAHARSRHPATGVVAALEAQAEEEAAQLARKKRPRQQSKREEEWIAALVGRYGEDVGAMARDRRLNPMQQSEADIGRRVRKWRGRREDVSVVDGVVV
jgi:nucleolar protein 16